MIEPHTSIENIMRILGLRAKTARLARNQTQKQFSYEAGVPVRTLSRFENGGNVEFEVVLKILRTLERIEKLEHVFPELEISPIEQTKKKPQQRQRARSNNSMQQNQDQWQGFDESVSFEDGES